MPWGDIACARSIPETGVVNNFAVLQYQSGRLEIVELSQGSDPVDVARNHDAFLIGITSSRSRAEFILNSKRSDAVTTC